MRILGVIQVRMGSKRFPGKALAKLDGKPLLLFLLERLKLSKRVDSFVVATSVLPEDDVIVDLVRKHGYPAFRGHPLDVLDRFYKVSSLFGADIIVRITGDNPLTDVDYMDECVLTAVHEGADYVSAFGLPLGTACEVISYRALEDAYFNAKDHYQREHVTPYINENLDRFKVLYLKAEAFGSCDHIRLTVDYPEDLELLSKIFERMRGKRKWGLMEIVRLLKEEPDLLLINKGLYQKGKFDVDERWVENGKGG